MIKITITKNNSQKRKKPKLLKVIIIACILLYALYILALKYVPNIEKYVANYIYYSLDEQIMDTKYGTNIIDSLCFCTYDDDLTKSSFRLEFYIDTEIKDLMNFANKNDFRIYLYDDENKEYRPAILTVSDNDISNLKKITGTFHFKFFKIIQLPNFKKIKIAFKDEYFEYNLKNKTYYNGKKFEKFPTSIFFNRFKKYTMPKVITQDNGDLIIEDFSIFLASYSRNASVKFEILRNEEKLIDYNKMQVYLKDDKNYLHKLYLYKIDYRDYKNCDYFIFEMFSGEENYKSIIFKINNVDYEVPIMNYPPLNAKGV